jgi:recombination protein RecT
MCIDERSRTPRRLFKAARCDVALPNPPQTTSPQKESSMNEETPQKNDIRSLVQSDQFKSAVATALPAHLTPDRFIRIALTAITRTPKLMECDKQSFAQCLMQLSQFGLEPDGRHAHLIPFWNSKRNTSECQLIIDYKGLANLAMRSGQISYVHADKVCEQDQFTYDKGVVTKHVIDFTKDRGKTYAFYAMVKFKDGTEKADAMTLAEVNKIRARSRAKDSGPWVTDFDEMGKKTVFRRLSKWLPLSAEYRDAVDMDMDALEELRFDNAVPLIKRANVPKLKDLSAPVSAEPQEASHSRVPEGTASSGEAGEDTKPARLGNETGPDSPATQNSKAAEISYPNPPPAEPKKKPTLTRKKKESPSRPEKTNEVKLLEFLALGGYTQEQFMQIARENEWVSETETWPLAEGRLATFLTEDNRETIISELDAFPK